MKPVTESKIVRVIFSVLLALVCGSPLWYWWHACVSDRFAGELPLYTDVAVFISVLGPLVIAIERYLHYGCDIRQCVGSKGFRICVLALALISGLTLWCHFNDLVRDFFGAGGSSAGGSGISGKLPSHVEAVILSIVVVTALWFFRTHDTRQQIDQTNEQIKQTNEQIEQTRKQIAQSLQSDFWSGIENIGGKTPPEITVGTQTLIRVSSATNEFDPGIELAFITRLKNSRPAQSEASATPSEKSAPLPKFTHAQYMFKWLHGKDKRSIDELRALDLSHQEFRIPGVSMRTIVEVCDPLMSEIKMAHLDYRAGFFDVGHAPAKPRWTWRASGT